MVVAVVGVGGGGLVLTESWVVNCCTLPLPRVTLPALPCPGMLVTHVVVIVTGVPMASPAASLHAPHLVELMVPLRFRSLARRGLGFSSSAS